jgi:hypothetical protein
MQGIPMADWRPAVSQKGRPPQLPPQILLPWGYGSYHSVLVKVNHLSARGDLGGHDPSVGCFHTIYIRRSHVHKYDRGLQPEEISRLKLSSQRFLSVVDELMLQGWTWARKGRISISEDTSQRVDSTSERRWDCILVDSVLPQEATFRDNEQSGMNIAKVKADHGWTMRPYNVLNSFGWCVLCSVPLGGEFVVEQQELGRISLRVWSAGKDLKYARINPITLTDKDRTKGVNEVGVLLRG